MQTSLRVIYLFPTVPAHVALQNLRVSFFLFLSPFLLLFLTPQLVILEPDCPFSLYLLCLLDRLPSLTGLFIDIRCLILLLVEAADGSFEPQIGVLLVLLISLLVLYLLQLILLLFDLG